MRALFNASDIAKTCGVSVSTVTRMIDRHFIVPPTVKVGLRLLWPESTAREIIVKINESKKKASEV